jgi:DNA (cytosine-5)-methyltransferase 1
LILFGAAHLVRHIQEQDFGAVATMIQLQNLFIQEIIFLEHYYKGKYTVENVIPYYEPLIPAQKRGRHLYWTNFKLPLDIGEREFQMGGKGEVKRLCEFHAYDFYQYKGEQRIDKIARNLVDYEAGKTIFNIARGIIEKPKSNQAALFG